MNSGAGSGGGYFYGKRKSQVIALESLSSSIADPKSNIGRPPDFEETRNVSERQIEAFRNQAGARSVIRSEEPYMGPPSLRHDQSYPPYPGYAPGPPVPPSYPMYPGPVPPHFIPQGIPHPSFYPIHPTREQYPLPHSMGPPMYGYHHPQPELLHQNMIPPEMRKDSGPVSQIEARSSSSVITRPRAKLPLADQTAFFLGTFEDRPWIIDVCKQLGLNIITDTDKPFKFLVKGALPKGNLMTDADRLNMKNLISKARSQKSELCDAGEFSQKFKELLYDNTLDDVQNWKPDGPEGFLSYYFQIKCQKPKEPVQKIEQPEQPLSNFQQLHHPGFYAHPGAMMGYPPMHERPFLPQFPNHGHGMIPGHLPPQAPPGMQLYPAPGTLYRQVPPTPPVAHLGPPAQSNPPHAGFYRPPGAESNFSRGIQNPEMYCSSRMTKFINPPAHIKKQWENSKLRADDPHFDRRGAASSTTNYKDELKDLSTFGPGVDFKPVKYSAYQSAAPARKTKSKPPLTVTPDALAPEPVMLSEEEFVSRIEGENSQPANTSSVTQPVVSSINNSNMQAVAILPGFYSTASEGKSKSMIPVIGQMAPGSNTWIDPIPAPNRPALETPDPEWSVLYRPLTLDSVIGNKAVIQQLQSWIESWLKGEVTKNPNSKKGALITGPPGVGKTTTVRLLAEKFGYNLIEKNASDLRNKSAVETTLKILTANTTLDWYGHFTRSLVLMDEVDGMTSDAGGIPALTDFICKSKVPIICISNERNHQKIRGMVHHCLDLKFKKPDPEEILGYVRPIVKGEFKKQEVADSVLLEMIKNMNGDLRQLLGYLENAKRGKRLLSDPTSGYSKDKSSALSASEAASALMNNKERKNLNYKQLSNLFWVDWELVPPFIQENYLMSTARTDRLNDLVKLSRAADSLCRADLILGEVKQDHNYKLLDPYAFYSSLYPTFLVSVQILQVDFPSSFQRQSSQKKMRQEIVDLRTATMGTVWASSESLKLEMAGAMLYIYRYHISKISEGQPSDGLINFCEQYNLSPETLSEYIGSMVFDPLKRDPFTGLNPDVRRRVTADYNAKHKDDIRKKWKPKSSGQGDFETGDGDKSDDDDDGLEVDRSRMRSNRGGRRKEAATGERRTKKTGGGANRRGGRQSGDHHSHNRGLGMVHDVLYN